MLKSLGSARIFTNSKDDPLHFAIDDVEVRESAFGRRGQVANYFRRKIKRLEVVVE